jgi:hypothetical protein
LTDEQHRAADVAINGARVPTAPRDRFRADGLGLD